MFLLSACETKPVSEFQSDFTKELNTEAFDEMIDYAVNLSAQYSLTERVQESGYYAKMDESLAEMDIYETLRYFETNSTPEFYDLISKIIVDAEVIENEAIVHSQQWHRLEFWLWLLLPQQQSIMPVAKVPQWMFIWIA